MKFLYDRKFILNDCRHRCIHRESIENRDIAEFLYT